jgi:hypothetical protein
MVLEAGRIQPASAAAMTDPSNPDAVIDSIDRALYDWSASRVALLPWSTHAVS